MNLFATASACCGETSFRSAHLLQERERDALTDNLALRRRSACSDIEYHPTARVNRHAVTPAAKFQLINPWPAAVRDRQFFCGAIRVAS